MPRMHGQNQRTREDQVQVMDRSYERGDETNCFSSSKLVTDFGGLGDGCMHKVYSILKV